MKFYGNSRQDLNLHLQIKDIINEEGAVLTVRVRVRVRVRVHLILSMRDLLHFCGSWKNRWITRFFYSEPFYKEHTCRNPKNLRIFHY